ncbi:MAG: glutaredoxin family protein [Actinomycetales bacterium]
MLTDSPRITLLGKPGCHLCVQAREVIERVSADLGVGWQERSILDDPELLRLHRDRIPVVLVDGVELSHYWVEETALISALNSDNRT